jgi:hypothetical protein
LNQPLLSSVLSYVPEAAGVCKHWQELHRNPVLSSSKHIKIDRAERARLLAELYAVHAQKTDEIPQTSEEVQSPTERAVTSDHADGLQCPSSSSSSSSSEEERSKAETREERSPKAESSPIKRLEISQDTGPTRVGQHKVPAVAESKGRTKERRRPRPSSTQDVLLQNVQQIRSEQQLKAVMEYISSGLQKLEGITNEKRRVKKLIRAWNASYERKYGKLPTSAERKGHLRELHEEYQQVQFIPSHYIRLSSCEFLFFILFVAVASSTNSSR